MIIYKTDGWTERERGRRTDGGTERGRLHIRLSFFLSQKHLKSESQ